MSEDIPNFEKPVNHTFTAGEHIYVIDPNGFDLYAAEIRSIGENSWHIHYPLYPEDDFTAKNTSRFLLKTEKNTAIFNEQESIRLAKAIEEEEESTGEPDDPSDEDAHVEEEE